jgi:hypothetical protein
MRYFILALSAMGVLYGLLIFRSLIHQGVLVTSGCPNVAGSPELCVLTRSPASAAKVEAVPDGKYLTSIRRGDSK